LPEIAVCGVCRSANPHGMKFCRSCGAALAQPAPAHSPVGAMPGMPPGPSAGNPKMLGALQTVLAPPPPSALASTVACQRCGTQTPVGFAFCQQCGLPMQAAPDPGSARARAPSSAPLGIGGSLGGGRLDAPIDPHAGTIAQDEVPPGLRPSTPRLAAGLAARPGWGAAVLVNRDGTDGQRYSLVGEYVVIGRAGSDIAFDDDRFLARQHARIERAPDGAVKVEPLDTLNGVFRKADAPVELVDGMTILVGREVLRYERVEPEEVTVHPLVRHGVALFGSPPREPWGRLVQVIPSGGYRDVRHLTGPEVVLGREEGDIVFRDDAFMSRRHAAVTWDGRRAQIVDLGSSNGTFVRVSGPTALRHGDHVRLGDQLLRVELGG
jgi:pSer/pThr/pTyr-binding forkhead associated (FHA) protein